MISSNKSFFITVCIKLILLNFMLNFPLVSASTAATSPAIKFSKDLSTCLTTNLNRCDSAAIKRFTLPVDVYITPELKIFFFQITLKVNSTKFHKNFKGISIGVASARAPPLIS